jgi:Uma2 family endonuclease
MSIAPLPTNSLVGTAATAAAPVLGAAAEADIPLTALRRFTVEEYHALIASGFFAEDERYELLRGLLVHKTGKNRAHSIATHLLRQLLERIVDGAYVASQEPVVTSDSEPEPDVAVIRGNVEDYKQEQPSASSAPLVAEVSDTTLAYDRGVKKQIYAEAGIAVYWIVNLVDRQIEIYSNPSGAAEQPGYASCDIFTADGEAPVVIDGREAGRIAVNDVLP